MNSKKENSLENDFEFHIIEFQFFFLILKNEFHLYKHNILYFNTSFQICFTDYPLYVFVISQT